MTEENIRIGRVVSVSGSGVLALLENPSDDSEDNLPSLQIGALVKMLTPSTVVYGVVSGLSIPIPDQSEEKSEMKIVQTELLGEVLRTPLDQMNKFARGVSISPALGDPIYATTPADLSQVYARPEASNFKVGTLHQDRNLPVFVETDDLLGKHFAILGTTGSGKSCAVTLTLRALLDRHNNAHVVLLDPHNEYSHAFGDVAEVLDIKSLQLPYWLFNSEEIMEVLIDRTTGPRAAEATILNEVIPAAKRIYLGDSAEARFVTTDTPVPYRITDLIKLINETMGKLENPESLAPYLRLLARLNALRADARYGFMFSGLTVSDNMAAILSRIYRVPVDGRPITIIDLSGVPSEILNVVVSVLCRMTFDLALWSDRSLPIMLVCEEAHRYAPNDSSAGFEPTKRALARIANEGRKYGVSLCVVSQRPSDLATTILSQCNTIFALRMSNQKDQEFVGSAMSESALGMLDFLPSLRNGEAIVVGEGVSVPVRLVFDVLEEHQRPRSGTASFSRAWGGDPDQAEFSMEEAVMRWRRQRR